MRKRGHGDMESSKASSVLCHFDSRAHRYGGEIHDMKTGMETSLAAELGVGAQTLKDIIQSLKNPDQDPRDDLLGIPPVAFMTAKGMRACPAKVRSGIVFSRSSNCRWPLKLVVLNGCGRMKCDD